MKIHLQIAVCTLLAFAPGLRADEMMGPNTVWQSPLVCGPMSVWDVDSGMCQPFPTEGMPMTMLMLHGNLFGTRVWTSGPRGRDSWAGPDMVMADLGTTVGARHYLNVDLMLTAEKWLFPEAGYPLPMQIGESNAAGVPFIDAQHPHSSPIMGLTFSDTIALGTGKDHLKLFFAPRGEAMDGPVAFMHRTTGMVNPDAPLGHHIGQDVGHISSTVIGASLQLGDDRFEASTYDGTEPQPTKVDLPLGTPDSFSLRYIRTFSPTFYAMASIARVSSPEPDLPDILFENRYSASGYWQHALSPDWAFYNTLIYGLITHYDHADFLSSFTEEFLFRGSTPRIWGRMEVLQRTPEELAIPAVTNSNDGRWVAALTLGYTHKLLEWEGAELGAGGSVTKDFLPGELQPSYGGNPWAGKVFLQLGGMHMWGL